MPDTAEWRERLRIVEGAVVAAPLYAGAPCRRGLTCSADNTWWPGNEVLTDRLTNNPINPLPRDFRRLATWRAKPTGNGIIASALLMREAAIPNPFPTQGGLSRADKRPESGHWRTVINSDFASGQLRFSSFHRVQGVHRA
jgi:hypothetical protein